jgi:release factor glutamine methyltransferase
MTGRLGAPLAVSTTPEKSSSPARWTIKDVLQWTKSRFEERGLESPRLDAEILTAQALGVERLQLYVQFDRPLTAPELALIRESVKRRQAGESVAYVIGKKEFYGLEFAVDARVLVPRPDTETLVEEALARIGKAARTRKVPRAADAAPPEGASAEDPPTEDASADAAADASASEEPRAESPAPVAPPKANPRIADVGTGSGAIAVTLAKERPDAIVFATDLSSDALDVARTNALRHGVTITFLEGDLEAPLRAHAPFDLVTANLPYVPARDLASLPAEVRAEPAMALDGGPDGLVLVRRLVTAAPALLAPGGALVLEIGVGQAQETAALCRAAGLTDVRVVRDLGKIERVVSAVRA